MNSWRIGFGAFLSIMLAGVIGVLEAAENGQPASYQVHPSSIASLKAAGAKAPDDDDDDDDEDYKDDGGLDDDGRIYKNPRNSPSPDCPRDEELALFLGQKCLRKCSSDEDCKSKKKKCLCDGSCGLSCIKPERECPALENPTLGRVVVSGKLFRDKATYTCEAGFHVVGLRERTCQADGQWSGGAPTCKQNVYCKSPPEMEHARHNAFPEQLTFDLDATIQYQCSHGFVTNGFPTAKCLAMDGATASWFGPDISCEPRSCGAPQDTAQGWHAGECYTYGCRVTYHCADGFELVGRNERFCQADGSWTPKELPACVPVQCPQPDQPVNGRAIFTSCSYNSVVSYECKYGYTLIGDTTRRCGADRKWSGIAPKCQEIDCGHPGPLYNGWLENIEAGTGLGASIIFRCHEGMLLLGNTSTVCQIDGKWRYPSPLCLAPCVVPQVTQGKVIIDVNATRPNMTSTGDSVMVSHGDHISLECEERYEPALNNTPITCNNGTWSFIPRCQPARCKYMAKAPRNGMVFAPKTEHGMKARYTCKDGFTLRGESTTLCHFGNWTGEPPYCQEVYCPFPGYVDNGKVLLVGNMGLYDYRPYVRKVTNNKQIMYDCNRGYVLADGPPGATCVGGHWSPKQLPRCVPGQHPRLRWSRSVRSKRAAKFRKIFRAISLRTLMRAKRALSGSSSTHVMRKTSTGSSSSSSKPGAAGSGRASPTTKPGEKGGEGGEDDEKENEENGNGQEGGATKEGRKKAKGGGKKAKQGNRTTSAVSRGKGAPCDSFVEENVESTTILKEGRDSNVTYSTGVIIRVTCSRGYSLNIGENVTARCIRGRWKPDKPHCRIKPCSVPASEHGIYTRSSNGNGDSANGNSSKTAGMVLNETTEVAHNQVVEFSCSVGYNIQGPANLKCWYGVWAVASLPDCSPAPCELPHISHGQYLLGYRAGLTIGNGSSVTYQCDADYRPTTHEPLNCVLGELRPRSPSCKKDGGEYITGGDITKAGGEMGAVDYLTGLRGSCGPPARVQGSLVFRNGEPLAEAERSFPDGTEVTFNCIASIMGERNSWRIVCEDGSWLGRALSCDVEDPQDSTSTVKDNSTCTFRNTEPNVSTFYRDQPVTEEQVEFPSGAILLFRCADIGKYAMIGSQRRKCSQGEWDGQRPVCFGLNQENDYALEKPPTILFRHQLGPIAQSNQGTLIVYPGTILHMECLWIRRFGTPKWAVSHNYRKYPEGWSSDPGRDSQLEYRLSIFHASRDDSGTFTCITPTRHTHSVEIEVKAVHCNQLPSRRGLKMSTTNTKMNTRVILTCNNGNSLIGAPELVCLPSGNWSAPMPVCESMECPDLINLSDPNLRASILSREVGGQVMFSCSQGFGLVGPAHSTCQPSGEWASPLPTCREVQCDPPGIPENGFIQGQGTYKAGDLVQFSCNPDHMMEGQPIIACQENGRWSGSVPRCVQACSYPGTAISGRMSSVKFYYQIGETVTFTCDNGLVMQGAAMLRCLRNGKWSNTIPTCVSPAA
ncbi:sushi, von Willebrand factor type A, EGF and pentraxin domain-containing protein 1 isoform X2 [Nilaparvata lugens]|uniref:sushi, von Willebrand factor type A, EGF and pentraxin domain-containing protein 1 isoform X2 n=1 Tax=Nilaparvata lugens TaxID=108931 RepID=UPI00193E5CBA|nr:sushi, von Willebrand factor type A, EGF and pentraxin domain-containing protein 1 isoform X2 [Nilaparvata lugens]